MLVRVVRLEVGERVVHDEVDVALPQVAEKLLIGETLRRDKNEIAFLGLDLCEVLLVLTGAPALVLMRDYFGVCLAVAVVLSSVLFGTFMVMARGAMANSVQNK